MEIKSKNDIREPLKIRGNENLYQDRDLMLKKINNMAI